MKRHNWSRIGLVALLGWWLSVLPAGAQAPMVGQNSTAAQVVRGDVLNIEGETYIIKDMSGHEVQLRVTSQTKQEDRIKVGDKIEAQVGSDGHAQSIRVQIPQ
ncbi:hypothetical protein [Candidatus Nitrospira bockiana]